MPSAYRIERVLLSDEELLETIRRDLYAVYSDVIRQPLPPGLAAALQRIETRSNLAAPASLSVEENPARP